MKTITEKLAEALRNVAGYADEYAAWQARDGNDPSGLEIALNDITQARTTLAEYEAQRYGARIPEEFARKTLADYSAEIATGTVNYPFYAGAFSQLVRGVVE